MKKEELRINTEYLGLAFGTAYLAAGTLKSEISLFLFGSFLILLACIEGR